ncbi:MAG: hypothetical protein JWO40_64 [Candidatus Doudnabacteria bacterium]|nr:hypothetical protein [Candidatus Doudnabacteria bacterium]
MSKILKIVIPIVLFILVAAAGGIYYKTRPNTSPAANNTETQNTTPEPVKLTADFPTALMPKDGTLVDSKVSNIDKVENNTTTILSQQTPKELYDYYLNYVSKAGYLILTKKYALPISNIYATSDVNDVNIVILKEAKDVKVVVSYVIKKKK